jgi:hypothetical protein
MNCAHATLWAATSPKIGSSSAGAPFSRSRVGSKPCLRCGTTLARHILLMERLSGRPLDFPQESKLPQQSAYLIHNADSASFHGYVNPLLRSAGRRVGTSRLPCLESERMKVSISIVCQVKSQLYFLLHGKLIELPRNGSCLSKADGDKYFYLTGQRARNGHRRGTAIHYF